MKIQHTFKLVYRDKQRVAKVNILLSSFYDIKETDFAINTKGDSIYNFRLVLLHEKTLLKRVLLYKERIFSKREQIVSLYSRPLLRRGQNNFDSYLPC